jgi:hypothetical protein
MCADEHVDKLITNHSTNLTSLTSVTVVAQQHTTYQHPSTGDIWLVTKGNPTAPATFLIPGVIIDHHLFTGEGVMPHMYVHCHHHPFFADMICADSGSKPEATLQALWLWGCNSSHFPTIHSAISNIVDFLGERATIGASEIVTQRRAFSRVLKLGKKLFSRSDNAASTGVDDEYAKDLKIFKEQGLIHTIDNKINFYELSESIGPDG